MAVIFPGQLQANGQVRQHAADRIARTGHRNKPGFGPFWAHAGLTRRNGPLKRGGAVNQHE
jgi:hypothetical protein